MFVTIARTLAFLPLIVGTVVAPRPVKAQIVPSETSTFCGSSGNVVRTLQSVAGNSPTRDQLTSLARSSIGLAHSADKVSITIPGRATSTATQVQPQSAICLSYPAGTVLFANAPTLRGTTLAALAAVLSYRETHRWPGAHPAHPLFADTSVYVSERGTYQYVSFIDNPARLKQFDGCGGEEYYRVDPASFDARPYNGCLVGGADLNLPKIDKLP